jgi:PPOX class probable FMN-dependent enzyme
MSKASPHEIESIETLREVIGTPKLSEELIMLDAVDEFAERFIARSPFLILSTADSAGNQDASPKGDAPGFVLIEDDKTLVIPDRPGNKLVKGHRNILENPRVGVLFMVPGTNETLRVNGRAVLTRDPQLLERLAARGRPAVLAIRIQLDECFFHCAKAFIRSQLWQPDAWGEQHRVSFGEIYAKKLGADASAAKSIEDAVQEDYRTEL